MGPSSGLEPETRQNRGRSLGPGLGGRRAGAAPPPPPSTPWEAWGSKARTVPPYKQPSRPELVATRKARGAGAVGAPGPTLAAQAAVPRAAELGTKSLSV